MCYEGLFVIIYVCAIEEWNIIPGLLEGSMVFKFIHNKLK